MPLVPWRSGAARDAVFSEFSKKQIPPLPSFGKLTEDGRSGMTTKGTV